MFKYVPTYKHILFCFSLSIQFFILVSYCWCRYVVCYAQIFLLFFDLFPIFKLSWRTSIPCRHSKKHVAFKKEEEKSRRPHKLFNWSIVCPNKMNMINDIHTWGYFMGLWDTLKISSSNHEFCDLHHHYFDYIHWP